MKKSLSLIIVFAFLISCNQADHSQKSDSSIEEKDSSKSVSEIKSDTSINTLSPEKDTLVFNLKMDSANQHVTVPIKILKGSELFASLTSPDKKANIRVSQLEFPDSTFDGPFGRTLDYKIKDTGNYKIIIGEDMMAGDRWKGNFILKTWVK